MNFMKAPRSRDENDLDFPEYEVLLVLNRAPVFILLRALNSVLISSGCRNTACLLGSHSG